MSFEKLVNESVNEKKNTLQSLSLLFNQTRRIQTPLVFAGHKLNYARIHSYGRAQGIRVHSNNLRDRQLHPQRVDNGARDERLRSVS